LQHGSRPSQRGRCADIGGPYVEFVDAVLYGEVGGEATAVSILLVIA
jgi:hypothetical protein